jgi:hypothetical protein
MQKKLHKARWLHSIHAARREPRLRLGPCLAVRALQKRLGKHGLRVADRADPRAEDCEEREKGEERRALSTWVWKKK